MRWIRGLVIIGLGMAAARVGLAAETVHPARPNILWITCEDTGPELGCYGDGYAVTPNLDALADRGVRYQSAWSNAPVCAPARTTIITGVYPTSTGSEHMRSEVAMPGFMRMFPQILREQGYYCTNNSKEDYNLTQRGRVWDDSSNAAHWKTRGPGQPFFAVFNLTGTHESRIRARPHTLQHDPAEVRVPAYHPDTPEVRHDWAQYYDNITTMDQQAGKRIDEIKAAGLADDTIVFFYGDHGSGMPRSKRWPYNCGLRVPLIVYIPERFKDLAPKDYAPGGASGRLVAFVDLAPTVLSLAGIRPPDWMQGHAFLGRHDAPAQPLLFGFRGRMDERYDMVRSVRNDRYIYIRNYMPHLIYGQHIAFMFQTPTTQVWKRLYDQGKLHPPQTFFWERKCPEELYDLQTDRDEVRNLVDSPDHQAVLQDLRRALREQALRTRDIGFLSEAEQHSRSQGTTPYDLGHDPNQVPLDRIMDMADLASLLRPEAVAALKQGLRDSDSAVRYWAAMGLLMRGTQAVEASHSDLRDALEDPCPSVRIIAAWALGQYGRADDLALALPVLGQAAPPDKNGVYVSILALSAIDALGPKAASLYPILRTMPTSDPAAVARANGYVVRLTQNILGSNP